MVLIKLTLFAKSIRHSYQCPYIEGVLLKCQYKDANQTSPQNPFGGQNKQALMF